jgi:hypothetical protein
MRFAYKRRGGPLLDWDGRTAPYQSRAGETRSLGSLELDVPRPGAPEIVSGYESPHPNAALIHFGADEKAAPAKFDTGLIRKAAALAAAYHGVKRNNGSIFWGVIWAAAALVTPFYGVFVPVWAAGQGFGQARLKNNPARTWGVKVGPAAARRKKHAAWKKRRAEIARTKKRRVGGRKTKRMGTRRGVGAYSLRKR